jgi:hypothetical protein
VHARMSPCVLDATAHTLTNTCTTWFIHRQNLSCLSSPLTGVVHDVGVVVPLPPACDQSNSRCNSPCTHRRTPTPSCAPFA